MPDELDQLPDGKYERPDAPPRNWPSQVKIDESSQESRQRYQRGELLNRALFLELSLHNFCAACGVRPKAESGFRLRDCWRTSKKGKRSELCI